jgi:hypothetical protein
MYIHYRKFGFHVQQRNKTVVRMKAKNEDNKNES